MKNRTFGAIGALLTVGFIATVASAGVPVSFTVVPGMGDMKFGNIECLGGLTGGVATTLSTDTGSLYKFPDFIKHTTFLGTGFNLVRDGIIQHAGGGGSNPPVPIEGKDAAIVRAGDGKT